MLTTSAFAVFIIGLRHGADPDHLAAIDNLTRNSLERTPRLARFVGAFFACGHSLMVLAIAALVGYLGSRFAAHAAFVESIGRWVSIVVLFLIATMNLHQLNSNLNERMRGLRTRLLPATLRDGNSPWLAIPIGALFGFGFETSSQIAAYAVAFGSEVRGALLVGAMFCIGMACTDTLDSLFVQRLVSHRTSQLPALMRVWIAAVTAFAFAVAIFELAQMLGWKPFVSDLVVSTILVGSLLAVFVRVYTMARPSGSAADPGFPRG